MLQPERVKVSEDVFLTPEELADRWKVSVNSLALQRFRGQGPKAMKLGVEGGSGAIRYRLSDIVEYEEQQLKA